MISAVKPDASGAMISAEAPSEWFITSILRGGLQSAGFKLQYDVSPDGERLLINEALSTGEPNPSPIIVTLNWKPPEGR